MRKIINYEKNKRRFLTITAASISVLLVISVGIIGAAPFSVQQQGRDQAPGQSVTSSNIVDGEVRNQDLADNAVTSDKIANGEVTSADIEDGTITSTDIAEGTIPPAGGGGTPPDNSVTSATIVDETIAAEDIGDGQVTNTELANDAVTTGNIVDGQVTSADIGDGEVGSADVADGSIGSADLAPDAIPPPTGGGGTPDDNSVTSAKIVDGAVTSADIGDGQVNTADLANGAVTRNKIASDAIQLTTHQVSRTHQMGPRDITTVPAICPPGEAVTGGGFHILSDMVVVASFQGGSAWNVQFFNPTESSRSVTTFATCAVLTP